MPKFRKKPVVIEAVQYNGMNADQIARFMGHDDPVTDNSGGHTMSMLVIATLEGAMTASTGDWIIKGVKGEFYPCRDDIFRLTYEEVPDAA